MKAIILAAGMGTRLGTLIPKPLTSILDEKTIMDFQISNLSNLIGIDNICAVVGYKKELIMERFPEITFVYNHAYTHTNTAKSLLIAMKKLDDDVLWVNGDVYFEKEAIRKLLASRHSAVLVDKQKCSDEEIKYNLHKDGSIKELSKEIKNGVGEAVGINVIKKRDLEVFKRSLQRVDNQDYFEKAIEILSKRSEIYIKPVYIDDFYCKEIDFPEDLREVKEFIKSTKGRR